MTSNIVIFPKPKQQISIMFYVSLIFVLYACAPSESAINTAIAQTQAANPTPTFTLEPTSTPAPTSTPSPTPDIRVIQTDPKEFLLKVSDLPAEGKYYLPNANWISPHHNTEIIQDRGAEAGKEYINDTGRVDGWFAGYQLGSKNKPLPDEIINNVIMFNSITGAQVYMNKYAETQTLDDGFIKVDSELVIGDITKIFVRNKNGNITYYIEFSYRNYVHRVTGYGLEANVDPTLIEDISRLLLANLQDAALSSP